MRRNLILSHGSRIAFLGMTMDPMTMEMVPSWQKMWHHQTGDGHGSDDNGDGAELAKDVAPPNSENMKKKARQ
ncbi:hypothetical protein F2Q68_00043180 [Brassica cretica]|uniref:Uncharacterized protein n=1 Tax=Brassica cretica TaxID=69181 RepID=A0A8S9LT44_BRACR|nr:hypothetical protein F2Q68_00043180 [Brassica cretica]